MLYATCSMRIPQYSISAWIFTACSQKHTCDDKQRCQSPQLFCQACKHCGALQVAQYMWIIFFFQNTGRHIKGAHYINKYDYLNFD